jgi:cytochrome c oxidase assembly factor CtaG
MALSEGRFRQTEIRAAVAAVVVGGWSLVSAFAWALLPASVLAHGVVPEPSSWVDVLLAWSIEPHVILPLLAAWFLYRWAVRRVDLLHPTNRVPRFRVWCWYGGLLVLFIALASPIGTYDTTLFSVHMVQHLLMIMVAAPLLAIAAPITLLLRVSSGATRQRWIFPVLHSRLLRVISFPVVTWVLFAGTMWVSHFSGLYDASLESEPIHIFEHGLYLLVALLFWWPVVGADPSPWRMPHPGRIGYLFLGMPQSSFLGLAILSAPAVLYAHYATLQRTWGPTPLEDQQLAGAIMWVGGDAVFFVALLLAVWVWLRAEEVEGRRVDARLDREAAAASRHSVSPATPAQTTSAPTDPSLPATTQPLAPPSMQPATERTADTP